MPVKKILGILFINDGIIGFLLGLYRITVDVVTPGRYTFTWPFTPHEIKYISFTVACAIICIVGVILVAKKKKEK